MNKTILKKILIHTVFPLSVGIAIYYFGRDWTHLEIGKLFHSPNSVSFPDWVKYNLPDGLWLYAFTCLNIFIWKNSESNVRLFWIAIIPITGFTSEIMQYYHIILGTYDLKDIICYFISIIVIFFNFHKFLL